MNTALNRIFDFILGALDLFRFWIVLDDYEAGVILRLGRFHHEVGPGFHLRRPARVDVLKFLNVRKKAGNPWEMTLTTRDGTTVTLCYAYCIEVICARTVLLSLDDWEEASYRLCKIAVAKVVHECTDEYFFSEDLLHDTRSEVTEILQENGIGLCEFGITERARSPAFRLFKGAN
jgi:regulator of protease activity HflC (stomatin/prohibitin superfamily)